MNRQQRLFWTECYRDVLREIARVQGVDGLLQAPRIGRVCASLADEGARQLAIAGRRCEACRGDGFDPSSDTEARVCVPCRGSGRRRSLFARVFGKRLPKAATPALPESA